MSDTPRHRRPSMPGAAHFETLPCEDDPTTRGEAADRCATLLVRGARETHDEDVVARVVTLADSEGLATLAELWANSPSAWPAGWLWRLSPRRACSQSEPAAAGSESPQDLSR